MTASRLTVTLALVLLCLCLLNVPFSVSASDLDGSLSHPETDGHTQVHSHAQDSPEVVAAQHAAHEAAEHFAAEAVAHSQGHSADEAAAQAHAAAASALLEAVANRNVDALALALDTLANNANTFGVSYGIDVTNDQGWTAVRFAVQMNDMGSLQLLIGRGADLNKADLHGVTPLMAATAIADRDMVEMLLAHGASPLLHSVEGKSAIDYAELSNRPLLVYLLAEAAAVHGLDQGNLDEVVHAVRRGAFVNMRNEAGWTALMLASSLGHVDAVRELLEVGAEVNHDEQDGWTALHFAAAHGYDEVVTLLLSKHADPHILTFDGRSARHLAEHNKNQIVVDLLSDV